jgi:VanZ family protein
MNGPAFAIAVAAAAALILSASFISQVRHVLRNAFPNHFLLILGAIVGGSIALAVIAALLRIRDRRAVRYTAIGAALVIGTSYSLLTSSPDPQVAAVERFHFIQYGIITFLFYRAWRPLGDGGVLLLPLLAAMLTGTLEEWFQWFIPGRVGTVDDVVLNWVAIACGLLFSVGFTPPTQSVLRFGSRSIRHGGTAAALFVIVFGMFFDSVHLGYAIHDPKIGTFTSIYTQPELEAHSRDRAIRWQTDPPIDRTRLAREDQYRTEGIQHVQERNEAWARGDVAAAWRENLILETYYATVVERGHGWPREQKADALARAGEAVLNDGHGYWSQAYPYRVHTWPRAVFWGCTVGLAAAILLLFRYSPGRR